MSAGRRVFFRVPKEHAGKAEPDFWTAAAEHPGERNSVLHPGSTSGQGDSDAGTAPVMFAGTEREAGS